MYRTKYVFSSQKKAVLAIRGVLLASALALLSPGAWAANPDVYPSKPVKVIVPFAPGGGIDILIRAIGNELSKKWGYPLVVENKPGASTFIGAESAARSEPDGYTLFATVDPTFTANRFLFAKMPYDPDRSFAPIMQMVRGDSLLLANPKLPAADLKELVVLARKQKGKFAYSSFGAGSQPQLTYEYLNTREGLDLLHVPYNGITPAMTAAIAGEVQLGVASAAVAGEMVRGGQLKILAVAGPSRLKQFPDVKTAAEQGFPYLRASIWYGLFAPAGTPPALIAKINADVKAVLENPDFSEKFVTSKGLVVVAGDPVQLSAAIRDDSALIGEMVKAAGVKPE